MKNDEILPGIQPVLGVVPNGSGGYIIAPSSGGGGSSGASITPSTLPSVAVTDTSVKVLDNPNAGLSTIYNSIGGSSVTLSYSNPAAYDQGFTTLLPGGTWEAPRANNGSVYAICATGATTTVTPSLE